MFSAWIIRQSLRLARPHKTHKPFYMVWRDCRNAVEQVEMSSWRCNCLGLVHLSIFFVFQWCLGEPQIFKQLISCKFALILVCLRLEQMWKSFYVCLPRIKSHLWVLWQLETTVSHLLWQASPSLSALLTMVPYYIVTHLRNQRSGCQTCDSNHIMSWHSRFISHPQRMTQIPCYELQLKWFTANVKLSPGLFRHSFPR